MTNAYLVVIPSGRLCENTVHGSTRLTTNGVVSLEIEYLSVRPEHRRRAPREFSHSLSFEMTACDFCELHVRQGYTGAAWRHTRSSTIDAGSRSFALGSWSATSFKMEVIECNEGFSDGSKSSAKS